MSNQKITYKILNYKQTHVRFCGLLIVVYGKMSTC